MPLPELRIHICLFTAYRIKSKSLYLEIKTLHYLTAYLANLSSHYPNTLHCHIHPINLFPNHKIQCEFYILSKAFPFPSSQNYSTPFPKFPINSITGHLIIYLLLPRYELSAISNWTLSFFPQEHLTFTKKADAQTVLLQAEGNFDWLTIGITYHKIQPI